MLKTDAGRSHEADPGAAKSPAAIAKIREILTPVIVANTLRENPGTDPALIAAQITEAQLLHLASFAGPLHAEAQRAGIDLQEWRLRQSAAASSDPTPPTSPHTIMPPPASPVVPMDLGTASPSASPSSTTTRVAHQAPGHKGVLSSPTAKSEGAGFALADLAANAASSTLPTAEPSRAPRQLHVVHRTLCTITGSESHSVVALPFELTTTEMDSVMRWAQRHQDIEYVLYTRRRLICSSNIAREARKRNIYVLCCDVCQEILQCKQLARLRAAIVGPHTDTTCFFTTRFLDQHQNRCTCHWLPLSLCVVHFVSYS